VEGKAPHRLPSSTHAGLGSCSEDDDESDDGTVEALVALLACRLRGGTAGGVELGRVARTSANKR
jgi:hypothetical protein